MAQYTVQVGDTIGDAILNSNGIIANWGQILDANNFDSWTPVLIGGEIIQIPDSLPNDLEAVRALQNYPASNSSSDSIYGLIGQIFQKLLTATPQPAPVIAASVQDTNSYYEVLFGNTIGDVVLNSTGKIDNWQAILDANNLDWNPQLTAGQLIAIPSTVDMDLNAFRALQEFPVNNNGENDIYNQINTIFDILSGADRWILATSYWNDYGIWIDTSFWMD